MTNEFQNQANEIRQLQKDVECGVNHIELLFKWVVHSKGSIVENHTCWNARKYIEMYRARIDNVTEEGM